MTEKKSLKHRVRTRMSKTGERYTAARRQVLARRGAPAPMDPPAGMTSDASMRARTGRSWGEWFEILTDWGAAERPHGEIARFLHGERGVDGWWSQQITVGYEIAIGRRVTGQRGDGTFSATATRTIAAPVERTFDAVVDDAERARWLPDAPLRLRNATRPKTARFDWEDGATRVIFWFEAADEARTRVAMEHERLSGAEATEEMKAFWRGRLVELRRLLEG